MVFSMIAAASIRLLVRLHGKINASVYKEILKKHVPNLRTAINQPTVFMQDNAPCHTAKSVKIFLSEWGCNCYGVTCSKDRHESCRNAWKLLNKRPKEKNPRNIEELWTNLKGQYENISVDECKTLIRSCSKKCQAVIKRKCLHIKYQWIMKAILI